jgi:pyruvate carboxylase
MGYLMYPKVFTDYATAPRRLRPGAHPAHQNLFLRDGTRRGNHRRKSTRASHPREIQPAGGGRNPMTEGEARVFFEFNGQPRTIRVPNRKADGHVRLQRPKAEVRQCQRMWARRCPGSWPVWASRRGAVGQAKGDLAADHRGHEDGNRSCTRNATPRSRPSMSPPAGRSMPRTCCWNMADTNGHRP